MNQESRSVLHDDRASGVRALDPETYHMRRRVKLRPRILATGCENHESSCGNRQDDVRNFSH